MSPADYTHCASCDVSMSRADYNLHLSMCVSDSRTTMRWLASRADAPVPRRRRIAPELLNTVGLVVASVLATVGIVLSIMAFTIDWWWNP